MISALFTIVKTVVFAAVAIFIGSWLIDHSLDVSTKEYQKLLGRGGHLLAWTGALSILLTVWELVLWPWFSLKEAWNKHKDSAVFVGFLALGWCILNGFFLHGVFWTSG